MTTVTLAIGDQDPTTIPAGESRSQGALLAAKAEDAERRGESFAEQLESFRRPVVGGRLTVVVGMKTQSQKAQINGRDVSIAEFKRFMRQQKDDDTDEARLDLAAHGIQIVELRPDPTTSVRFAVLAGKPLEQTTQIALDAFYGPAVFHAVETDGPEARFQSADTVAFARPPASS